MLKCKTVISSFFFFTFCSITKESNDMRMRTHHIENKNKNNIISNHIKIHLGQVIYTSNRIYGSSIYASQLKEKFLHYSQRQFTVGFKFYFIFFFFICLFLTILFAVQCNWFGLFCSMG